MTDTITHQQFLDTGKDRFGENPLDWAFVCPACNDVATGHDFEQALADHPRQRKGRPVVQVELLGQECIGRTLGALQARDNDGWAGRGCDWAAYGLIGGPLLVEHEGRIVPSFRFAERQAVSA